MAMGRERVIKALDKTLRELSEKSYSEGCKSGSLVADLEAEVERLRKGLKDIRDVFAASDEVRDAIDNVLCK